MKRLSIVYQDKDILVTRDFIRVTGWTRETVPISEISELRITRHHVGSYRAGAIMFLIFGIVWTMVVLPIGLIFFPLSVGAWVTKIYRYRLEAKIGGEEFALIGHKSRRHLASIHSTLRGLQLSHRLTTLEPT